MIVSVGEVVWDIFPDGKKVLGGAPVNVAYHLASLGLDMKVITCVGDDELGALTLQELVGLGLSLDGVQKGELATGQVQVSIDEDNEPHFDIVAPAAWDAIGVEDALKVVGDRRFDMVFGTLAQRDARSRSVIRALWRKATRRFYDVNLRPPFTTRDLVIESLQAADLVKLNNNELLIIAEWLSLGVQEKRDIGRIVLERFDLTAVVVTEGEAGAWLVSPEGYFEDGGVAVTVADTVGAGDSFFASLIEGYVHSRPWPEALHRANRRGAFVASQQGATPPMPDTI